ncbi:MAG: hypothetical protein Harvfovirus72_5 [Harvfovirus sp.]|uniref:Uncharacterized protein n=1 Tax=Harvfovirus sp. TaxID=2487768 RepID=A0A3G5A6L8_9VIRU|nr:MAG: hypothetical protein Harvfovirus72_5 [Harvfovirus sp.]
MGVGGVNIYQVCGKNQKGNASIKFLGLSKARPTIKIHEFIFKNYRCDVVSYLLGDSDIRLADERCTLKMLGIVIKGKKKMAAITFSFYTFVHKRDRKGILDYVTFGEGENEKVLPGFFGYELRTRDEKGLIREERIGKLIDIYPGKTQCIYGLVQFLSDEKLSFLFV